MKEMVGKLRGELRTHAIGEGDKALRSMDLSEAEVPVASLSDERLARSTQLLFPVACVGRKVDAAAVSARGNGCTAGCSAGAAVYLAAVLE